jgi:hypothetical protein
VLTCELCVLEVVVRVVALLIDVAEGPLVDVEVEPRGVDKLSEGTAVDGSIQFVGPSWTVNSASP